MVQMDDLQLFLLLNTYLLTVLSVAVSGNQRIVLKAQNDLFGSNCFDILVVSVKSSLCLCMFYVVCVLCMCVFTRYNNMH